MTVYINNDTDFDIDEHKEKINEIVKQVIVTEKIPQNIEVSLSFVDNETIKELNKNYRKIDKVTDVLSFPINDFSNFEDNNFSKMNIEINNDTNEYILGDIIISYEQAKKQAEEYGHSLGREINFLTAHSMLHLLGYDHIDKEDEVMMINKQKEILDKVGLPR